MRTLVVQDSPTSCWLARAYRWPCGMAQRGAGRSALVKERLVGCAMSLIVRPRLTVPSVVELCVCVILSDFQAPTSM